jgi:hypothetical protein
MAIKKLSLLDLRRRRDRLNEGYFFFLAAAFFFGAGFFALALAGMMFSFLGFILCCRNTSFPDGVASMVFAGIIVNGGE